MVVAPNFVLDASFAMAWIFDGERNSLADEAWSNLVSKRSTAHVSSMWPFEITNVVVRGPRDPGKRLAVEDAQRFFGILREMPIRVYNTSLKSVLSDAAPLMRKHRLTSYDTSYLLLAFATGLPLATNDKALRDAALAEGVEIVV